MMQKVSTDWRYYFTGEHVDRDDAETINQLITKKEKPAKFIPILNRITRQSSAGSFIASFQEATRVLTEAAATGKR